MNLVSSMRTTPTVNWDFTSCYVHDGAVTIAIKDVRASYATPNSVEFDFGFDGNLNPGNPGILYIQADFYGYIILTSEL